ncbi:hypothetical protein LCGC14_1666720, partial [marine sediment metagenome]
MGLCECGCMTEVKKRFVRGHNKKGSSDRKNSGKLMAAHRRAYDLYMGTDLS